MCSAGILYSELCVFCAAFSQRTLRFLYFTAIYRGGRRDIARGVHGGKRKGRGAVHAE